MFEDFAGNVSRYLEITIGPVVFISEANTGAFSYILKKTFFLNSENIFLDISLNVHAGTLYFARLVVLIKIPKKNKNMVILKSY